MSQTHTKVSQFYITILYNILFNLIVMQVFLWLNYASSQKIIENNNFREV